LPVPAVQIRWCSKLKAEAIRYNVLGIKLNIKNYCWKYSNTKASLTGRRI
jgi:hypothetical protein